MNLFNTAMNVVIAFAIFIQSFVQVLASERFNILVFGGNGFIGSETIERILSGNHEVTIINRGNWRWDTALTVKPFVRHIICDRTVMLKHCSDLQSRKSENGRFYDFIIDFSSFDAQQLADAVTTFHGLFGKYIYISTDSVYEVCAEKNHTGFSKETDSVRPFDLEKREEYKHRDEYGNDKLEGEEVLINSEVPYLIFRLPDVIGPRDNTFRWWFYQLWIKVSESLPSQITIPKRLFYKPLSFVYVKDVVDIITKSLYLPDSEYNETYNLGFREVRTLYQVLSHIRGRLDKDHINIMLDERPNYSYFYPSVTLGPVNIQKAINKLGWQPTSFYDAADETIQFYEKAINDGKFDREANKVIDMLRVHFHTNIEDIYRALKDEYGQSSTKDEL